MSIVVCPSVLRLEDLLLNSTKYLGIIIVQHVVSCVKANNLILLMGNIKDHTMRLDKLS